ncbi:MAG: hypothetical protein PUE10_00320, partial [Bacteroidales bacterium]|nr:hypothetical protein [Bacteroidales bacterium]
NWDLLTKKYVILPYNVYFLVFLQIAFLEIYGASVLTAVAGVDADRQNIQIIYINEKNSDICHAGGFGGRGAGTDSDIARRAGEAGFYADTIGSAPV